MGETFAAPPHSLGSSASPAPAVRVHVMITAYELKWCPSLLGQVRKHWMQPSSSFFSCLDNYKAFGCDVETSIHWAQCDGIRGPANRGWTYHLHQRWTFAVTSHWNFMVNLAYLNILSHRSLKVQYISQCLYILISTNGKNTLFIYSSPPLLIYSSTWSSANIFNKHFSNNCSSPDTRLDTESVIIKRPHHPYPPGTSWRNRQETSPIMIQ